jgi:LCP family protein required for cell wall assembly
MLRRVIVVGLLIFGLGIIVSAFYWLGSGAYRTYGQARDWSNRIYEPLNEIQVVSDELAELSKQEQKAMVGQGKLHKQVQEQQSAVGTDAKRIDNREPFTILLMGVDERKGDKGRADTLIFAAVNPQKQSTLVFSIPRDTRSHIAGRKDPDKINHAYAYGGVQGTVNTVEQLLDVEVNYYFKVNMEGFREIVDVLGGIQIDNHQAFDYEGFRFAKGEIELDGEETLAYVRMRYEDPRGDLGRGDRQRAVLTAMKERLFSMNSIGLLTQLFDKLSHYMKTNISFHDWKSLVKDYRDAADTVQVEQIAGHGTLLSNIYYYLVTDEEISRVRAVINQQLEAE